MGSLQYGKFVKVISREHVLIGVDLECGCFGKVSSRVVVFFILSESLLISLLGYLAR